MFEKFFENKKRLYIIIGAFAVLVVVYIAFSIYFTSHFFVGTVLNGKSVSGYSEKKVRSMMESDVGSYKLTFKTREGKKEEIKGSDIALKQDWDDGVKNLIGKQNGFAWPIKMITGEKLTTKTLISFDKDKLKDKIKSLECMQEANQTAPVNATVSEYKAGKGYTVVAEVEGNKISEEKIDKVAEDAINQVKSTVNLEKAKVYEEPTVRKDNKKLAAAVKKLNACAKSSITFEVGETSETLDINTFKDWMTVNDKVEADVNDAKLAEYVSNLSKKFNTFGRPKQLKTSYGPTVTISNSHYGWKIDKDEEAAQIKKDILSGKKVSRELNYSVKAASHGANDYGDSYVEINLTAQHLYVIKNGNRVFETDVVTGNTSKGNGTPAGAFGVTYAQKDATLKGDNYESHVSYWMPFNGNIGMHDASWRNKFGGVIYKTSGSHGCVNLPVSSAPTVFSYVSKGFPVLVYELPGTERGTAASPAATATINAIKAIGAVTVQSDPAIVAARNQYNALPDVEKAQVTNYQDLVNAEATLNQLKAGQ